MWVKWNAVSKLKQASNTFIQREGCLRQKHVQVTSEQSPSKRSRLLPLSTCHASAPGFLVFVIMFLKNQTSIWGHSESMMKSGDLDLLGHCEAVLPNLQQRERHPGRSTLSSGEQDWASVRGVSSIVIIIIIILLLLIIIINVKLGHDCEKVKTQTLVKHCICF